MEAIATTPEPQYEYEYVYEYVYEDDYPETKGSAERGKSHNEKLNNEILGNPARSTKDDTYVWKQRGWSECSVTCGEGG